MHLCCIRPGGPVGAGVTPAVHELRHGQASHPPDLSAQGGSPSAEFMLLITASCLQISLFE